MPGLGTEKAGVPDLQELKVWWENKAFISPIFPWRKWNSKGLGNLFKVRVSRGWNWNI